MATTAAEPPLRPRLRVGALAVPRPGAETLFGAALALVLTAVGLRAGGGASLGPTTEVEMGLQLAGGLLVGGALLSTDRRRPLHGAVVLAAFAVLAALTAVSILWAVEPSDAWLETNQTLAYLAVVGGGAALAREAGAWWPALLGALLGFCGLISLYAVGSKVFPQETETFARLREPFGYWNAVGLVAAFGVPLSLWLGARRHGHAAVNALAHPLLGLFLVTMLLAYSRGALLAAAVGSLVWFALVPLRLRGAAVLASGTLGGGIVSAWIFAQDALTTDRVPLDTRQTAGLELGLAVLAMLAVLMGAGLGLGFLLARRAPRPDTRRTAGVGVLLVVAMVPVVFLGSLAVSDRGLGGSISEGWKSLTDPDATTPANDPSRLTAVGSVRARYWDQAVKVFQEDKLTGAGAGGYPTARRRFREDELVVRHAHGHAVQVPADLGILGILSYLALVLATLFAIARATSLRRRDWRRQPFTPERIGLLTAASVVVTFAVHALIDWTWSIPGCAVPALLCVGWITGRGRGEEPPTRPHAVRRRLAAGVRRPQASVAAAAVLALALLCAFATWQPLRSVQAGDDALDALDAAQTPQAGVERARELAQTARDHNPLSVQPLFELGVIETVGGRKDQAQRALEDAVELQPDNPETWLRLAQFTLRQQGDPRRTIDLLGPALYLDPRSDQAAALYLDATRQVNGGAGALPGQGLGTAPTP
ncbi:O-antigen ligase [Conexibacter sp. SYSU D00693]|uniref:O-antigen ligase family protein n=1 Tax=Conexibacter sp. SYSU D00693 TaxID=2812560 RepID=UPI00196A8088|nr:tetratricopeptide repeat protein [Conexibacter sp. SYSU D00693]